MQYRPLESKIESFIYTSLFLLLAFHFMCVLACLVIFRTLSRDITQTHNQKVCLKEPVLFLAIDFLACLKNCEKRQLVFVISIRPHGSARLKLD